MTFGWRGMLKIKHVPEQALDATVTPVLFLLMFTYLFGGAVAGGDRRVPAVHPPRHPRPVGALHRRLRGRRAEHRRDQGRRRPVPHAADLAARRRSSAPCSATASATLLASVIVVVARLHHGLRGRRRRRRRARGDRARRRLRVRPVVGVHDARDAPAVAERGDERRVHGRCSRSCSSATCFVEPSTLPGLARGVRRRQPDLARRHRGARAHGRRRGARATSCSCSARPRCSPRSSRRSPCGCTATSRCTATAARSSVAVVLRLAPPARPRRARLARAATSTSRPRRACSRADAGRRASSGSSTATRVVLSGARQGAADRRRHARGPRRRRSASAARRRRTPSACSPAAGCAGARRRAARPLRPALVYLWLDDGRFFNAMLVREGFATAAHDPAERRVRRPLRAPRAGRAARVHGACGAPARSPQVDSTRVMRMRQSFAQFERAFLEESQADAAAARAPAPRRGRAVARPPARARAQARHAAVRRCSS